MSGQGLDKAVFPTRYWHRLPDGKVQCDLCPRFCRLNEGQRGFCFVRARLKDEIVLTTYGRSSGFCVDPIEKKPLYHFLPGTPVFSFGTAGCNLACRFCQNWNISKSREVETLSQSASPGKIARVAKALKCRSVAFTYNDPVIFHEYAVDVARACRDAGILTVAVSAGYVCPAPREEFYREMDAANIDLKSFSEDFYRRLTVSHLKPVLETLEYIKKETKTWLEITTLVIPGENDSHRELKDLTAWIFKHLGPDVPLHFSAFHPDYKMMDSPRTPVGTLRWARKIALDQGLRYVYTGNVRDPVGESTFCSGCGKKLIDRDGYFIKSWALDEGGKCISCGTPLPGRWEAQPGRWGPRYALVGMDEFN